MPAATLSGSTSGYVIIPALIGSVNRVFVFQWTSVSVPPSTDGSLVIVDASWPMPFPTACMSIMQALNNGPHLLYDGDAVFKLKNSGSFKIPGSFSLLKININGYCMGSWLLMNSYVFSPSQNMIIPLAQKQLYVDAGTWPDDVIAISEETAEEFNQQFPIGKTLSHDENSQPCWVDIPPPTHDELIAMAELDKLRRIGEANNFMNDKQWSGKAAIGRLKGTSWNDTDCGWTISMHWMQ